MCEVSQRDHGRVGSLQTSNSRLLTLCSISRMYYALCVSFIPQIPNWSTLEPPVSSFSIQKAELCGHALHISWVKEKLAPCSQDKAHNDPKAQTGADTATVLVPQELKCSALRCTQKGCTQTFKPPSGELVKQHRTAEPHRDIKGLPASAQPPQPAASLRKASASLLSSGKSKQVRTPIAFTVSFGAWGLVLGQFTPDSESGLL